MLLPMLPLLLACTPLPSRPLEGGGEVPASGGEDSPTGTDSPANDADTDTEDTDSDPWHVEIGPIPSELAAEMQGTTMHEGCPVGLDALVLMQVAHWDMDGAVQTGRLVVAASVAADLAVVFEAMFRASFPIKSMAPASAFGGSDDASMAADNTSAFNCRQVTGGSGWSQHSYGNAIDINPIENPYVKGALVLPPEGAAYTDRSALQPGMIVEGDAVTAAFDAIGWGWGGRWSSLKDYQHFSENDQ